MADASAEILLLHDVERYEQVAERADGQHGVSQVTGGGGHVGEATHPPRLWVGRHALQLSLKTTSAGLSARSASNW